MLVQAPRVNVKLLATLAERCSSGGNSFRHGQLGVTVKRTLCKLFITWEVTAFKSVPFGTRVKNRVNGTLRASGVSIPRKVQCQCFHFTRVNQCWVGKANDDGGALVIVADASLGNIDLAFFWCAGKQHG
jgi:hypothetical protein